MAKFKKTLIADLTPLDYNPRKISKKRFKRLQASIREHTKALADWDEKDGFRFAQSVTINKQGLRIVGGHQRVDVMSKLGQDWIHEDDISWVDLTPGSPEEISLCVSLNDEEAAGRWDDDKKAQVLSTIEEERKELFEKLDLSALKQKLKDKIESATDATSEELRKQKERKAQFIDNVSFAVQEILDKHGDTIKNGFMLFTYKNRTHLIVQCNDDTYALTKMVGELLKRENEEVNKFLALAFKLGIEQSGWEDLEPEDDSYTPGEELEEVDA
jgi:hypothetical protein